MRTVSPSLLLQAKSVTDMAAHGAILQDRLHVLESARVSFSILFSKDCVLMGRVCGSRSHSAAPGVKVNQILSSESCARVKSTEQRHESRSCDVT